MDSISNSSNIDIDVILFLSVKLFEIEWNERAHMKAVKFEPNITLENFLPPLTSDHH